MRKKLLNILDDISVEYKRIGKKEDVFSYSCTLAISIESDEEYESKEEEEAVLEMPFFLTYSNPHKLISLSSKPLYEVSKNERIEMLELINEINKDSVFGSWYIDDDDELMYFQSLSFETRKEIERDEIIELIGTFSNSIMNMVKELYLKEIVNEDK